MATQAEVAEHLCLTDRQLRRLQKIPGAPTPRKRGDLDKDAWRNFYISYLRRAGGGFSESGDDGEEDNYEEKLLIARMELTSEQAITQRIKNKVAEGMLVDVGFCTFALSRLAMDLSSTLDSIPLSMQRKFPDSTPQQIEGLKVLVAKGANQCARAGEKLPELMDEYIRTANE
ncbi:terminase small subunit [Salmonella enterica]|nr:terminase [Salmonella enterica subsp. diarizonae serovar 17:z10:e,n,x,z15]EJI1745494.1 terminase small subunit [Salmonella enterica]EKR4133557.1 terminase small subunit [Salmonella enterica]